MFYGTPFFEILAICLTIIIYLVYCNMLNIHGKFHVHCKCSCSLQVSILFVKAELIVETLKAKYNLSLRLNKGYLNNSCKNE